MTAPGDETAAGPGGYLRASHADRDRVIDGLKAAFVQGRLDQAEFGHRVGQALAARTYADLAALTADLPAGPIAARPPGPARKRVTRPGVAVTACLTVVGGAMLIALRAMPDSTPPVILLPFLVLTLTLTAAAPTSWLLIFHAWLENRASSQAAAGLPPGAGGPAPRRATQASPAEQLPRTDRDLGITAEAAPRPSGHIRPHIAPAH
jgi:Domain of unknown function (DUF1707)